MDKRWHSRQMKKTLLALSLLIVFASFSPAAIIRVTGVFPASSFIDPGSGNPYIDPDTGNPYNIPDGSGALTNQVTVSGLVGPILGSQVKVRLIGLQHDAAGDLTVIIRHVASGVAETVFSQIRAVDPTTGLVKNATFNTIVGPYTFSAAPTGVFDLWATVAALGAVNRIPDSFEFLLPPPLDELPYLPSDDTGATHSFASLGTIVDPNGVWEISIQDQLGQFTGSILGWELEFTQVPEPGTMALALGALALCLARPRSLRH